MKQKLEKLQAAAPITTTQTEAYTQPILKIVVNRRQFDLPVAGSGGQQKDNSGEKLKNIKLVFIGQVPDVTNRTLRKLELGQQLTKPEETELNNQFPYFKTKVGSLDPEEYHVHFINQTIPNNTNTAQLELLVLDLLYGLGYITALKQIKQGMIMYGFPRVLQYSYIYDVLEYLYQDTSVLLTGEQICKQLFNKLIVPVVSSVSVGNGGKDAAKAGISKSVADKLLKELQTINKLAYSPNDREIVSNIIKLVSGDKINTQVGYNTLQGELAKLSDKAYSPNLQIGINNIKKLTVPQPSFTNHSLGSHNHKVVSVTVNDLLKDLKLTASVAYSPLELSNNAEFQKLIRQIPVVFAPRRYKKTTFENLYVSNDIYTFEAYQFFTDCATNSGNELLSAQHAQIMASVKYSSPDLSEYTLVDNSALDDIINFAALTTNNTLIVYLGADIHTWYDTLPQSSGRSNNFPAFIQTFHQRTQKFGTLDDFTVSVINNRRNFRVANTTGVWTQATLDTLGINPKWQELSNTVRTGICTQPALEVTGIKCKNFIFDCYDMGIETHINLKSLFQDIETNYYLPLVKYVSDRETQLYNIYKPFFRNLDERILNIFLRGKDRIMLFNEEILATSGKANIRRLKQLINWDYIVFKWRVDDDNLVNIYLFQNGYIITDYQSAQTTDVGMFIDQARVLGYMKLLTKIISKIKDKYKLSELSLPNPERILKTTSGLIEYCNLINVGLKYEFGFANRLLWAWTKLYAPATVSNKYDKLDDWIRAKGQHAAYDGIIAGGFIKKLNTALGSQPNMFVQLKYEEEIRFIYTSAFGFYSRDNAKYFMRTYLKDRGDRVGNAEKEKMFALVSRIFKITLAECQTVFEDIQSIELQTKYSFLYPVVECRLKVIPATRQLTLTIDNVSQYNLTPVILAQLDTLIKDVVLGTKQSVDLDMLLKDAGAILDLTCANAIESAKQNKHKHDKSAAVAAANKKKGKNAVGAIGALDALDTLDGIDINLDDINFGGLDMGIDMGGLEIDLDMDAIEKLILIESEDAENSMHGEKAKDSAKDGAKDGQKMGAQEEGLQDIKLKQFVGSKGKLTVVAYMKEMRKLFDPDLYEPVVKGKPSEYNYEHAGCPDTPKRQPFIVTKDKLKTIDPESITGYMRYNNNYYICPRIWDAKVDRPISARQFIENGLKSPYTGGLPVLRSPQKNVISDKYSVIIRKPTTGTYWSVPNLHPEWPELLKKTEKEAYPGLVHGKKHPNKVCVPCCFKHRPDDLDTTKTELQQFLKVSGSATCQYHGEPESSPGAGDNPNAGMGKLAKGNKQVDTFCKNEEYLSSAGTQLKNCRLGLLPEELNILLNNSQELFLKQNDAAIDNNANVFLRRGINENHVTNILDTFSAIFEMKLERLLNIIYNKLTPMDFIELNNGELVDIFCSATDYPIDAKDREKFIKFTTLYPDLTEYLNVDIRDILINLENRDITISGAPSAQQTTAKHQITINTRLLYRIYSAYYNYLSYLVSPNEIKNYRYVIQIFSRPRKWLIKQGVNILIFDKNSSQIKCLDNFNYKTDRLIILIEEAPNYFIPVFHIQSKYNQIQPPIGIIKLDETLNLTDTAAAVITKKRPTQQKLIDATKDRLSSIIRLLYVQAGLCNYNMSYYHAKLIKTIRTTRVGLITQYLGLGDSTQTQYLRIGTSERNSVFIPIYPHFIERRVTVSDFYGLANDMHGLRFNLAKLADNLYPPGTRLMGKDQEPYELMMLLDLGYHISEIIIERDVSSKDKSTDKSVVVTGVRFANDLELPLLPQEFKPKEISSIIARIAGKRADGHTTTITTKPIINLLKLLSSPAALSQASFNIHALLNLLLHQTKNNLSYFISGQQHVKDTGAASATTNPIKLLVAQIYNSNETARDEHLFYGCLDDVLQQIIKVDKETLTEYIRNYFTDRRTGKSRLVDKSYTRKVADLVCKKTAKVAVGAAATVSALCVKEVLGSQSKTRIRMPAEIYEYILMAVGKDLINNKIEADSIVKGRYIIPSDDLISSRVSNTIYNTTQDFQQNLIISPAEMSYYVAHNLISKYRRNFKLANPTAAIELGKETSLANKDLDVLSNIVIKDVKNRLVSGLSSIFSSISLSSASSDLAQTIQIKSTVFNSDGILNPAARHAPCVFPYKAAGKLNYHCGPAKEVLNGNKRRLDQQGLKENDLICPTEINNDKNVVNWGYCPSTPIATQNRLGATGQVTDAYQYANRNLLKKVGNCDFPFIYANRKIVNPLSRAKPFISVNYKCVAQGDSAPIQNGTWCYVGKSPQKTDADTGSKSAKHVEGNNKLTVGNSGDVDEFMDDAKPEDKSAAAQISLLIGAAKGETIYKGDWTLGDLVNAETGAPETREFAAKWERATGKNPAICEIAQDDTKREKIEKGLGLAGVERITRDTYNPDFCTAGASKKGYEKQQLYLFGRDELGINYKSMLNENNKILKKEELCELINSKLRDIKKADILAAAGTLDPEKLKELRQGIYTKDPALCMKGPTKGGYKLTELRDMAITYFGLSQAEADKIDKKQGFCDHISKALGLAIKFNAAEGSNAGSKSADNAINNMKDNEIYPPDRNIELCARPTSRGGLSSKDLKHIAGTKLGIDISGKSKEELCGLIKQKMIEIANAPSVDEERQNSVTAELRAARVEDAQKSEKETGSIGELELAEVDKLNL
jgi:hypothetical protein